MSETILKIENLSKSFGPVKALEKINLSIKKNEIQCDLRRKRCRKININENTGWLLQPRFI